jgi:hypothetical protein
MLEWITLIQFAVKPPPSEQGYKALSCFPYSSVLHSALAAGHAVTACGEVVRPGGILRLVRSRKIPHRGNFAAKTKRFPLGSLVEAGTRRRDFASHCETP